MLDFLLRLTAVFMGFEEKSNVSLQLAHIFLGGVMIYSGRHTEKKKKPRLALVQFCRIS